MRSAAARLDAVAHGRVQGVGFRFFVLAHARALGLTGWVANEPGGRVRCVAEGARPDLEQLLGLLEEGPAGARVERVDASWSDPAGGFAEFGVRSGFHGGD